jgi:5-methylcytosine-specific restriction endonuclease McrBC regulatory subunit McrC
LGAWPTEDSSAVSVPNSFFISLETLFEDAVTNVVRSVQPLAKKGAAMGRYIFPGNSNIYLADPDVAVPYNNGMLVMDAKYKDLQGHAPQHADVYQILEHSEAIGAGSALLVYPLEVGVDSEWQMTDLGTNSIGVRVFAGQVDVSRLEAAVIGLVNDVLSRTGSALPESDVG